jgi:hypothetical protein
MNELKNILFDNSSPHFTCEIEITPDEIQEKLEFEEELFDGLYPFNGDTASEPLGLFYQHIMEEANKPIGSVSNVFLSPRDYALISKLSMKWVEHNINERAGYVDLDTGEWAEVFDINTRRHYNAWAMYNLDRMPNYSSQVPNNMVYIRKDKNEQIKEKNTNMFMDGSGLG